MYPIKILPVITGNGLGMSGFILKDKGFHH